MRTDVKEKERERERERKREEKYATEKTKVSFSVFLGSGRQR
jgi:hypothetical protein